MKYFAYIALFLLSSLSSSGKGYSGRAGDKPGLSNSLAVNQKPLAFIENKGQVADQFRNSRADIQFSVAAAPGLNIFIGNGSIHYQFSQILPALTPGCSTAPAAAMRAGYKEPELHCEATTLYRMDVFLEGANPNARVEVSEKQRHHENYFGASTHGQTIVANAYNRIIYKDIYPLIDWELYMSDGHLKQQFVVHEGGRVSDIRMKYGGATDLHLNADGSLEASTPLGKVTEQQPVSYQEGRKIQSGFVLTADLLSYSVGKYSGDLTIDPTLEWATYFGGNGYDIGWDVATDGWGNVYLSGMTRSVSGIATTGAYQTALSDSTDAYLAKFNPAGELLWATYFGGGGNEEGSSIAVDDSGKVYMSGSTSSVTGIATVGSFMETYGGGHDDAYLAKFDSSGTLQWSTYYGGTNVDGGGSVAIGDSGYIYIAGSTLSVSGIATPGAYQGSLADSSDAFIAKFSNTGARIWATYFGGSGRDGGSVVAGKSGGVYIAGGTTSSAGIATPGAYQLYPASYTNAYLAKFTSSGFLDWATYYGGPAINYVTGVAIDDADDVYFTGWTSSLSGIATPGSYQDSFYGVFDAFLAKFDSSGAIQWATYYGGPGEEMGWCVSTNHHGMVFLGGTTTGVTGISTPGSFQASYGGGTFDGFLAQFSSVGVRQWATYFGTAGWDELDGIACDSSKVYVTGLTSSATGIATAGAHQSIFGGGPYDAYLAKITFCTWPAAGTIVGSDSVCLDSFILLTNSVPGGTWASSDTNIATVFAGTVRGKATGMDTIRYSVSSDTSCGSATVEKLIRVVSGCRTGVNTVSLAPSAITMYPNPVHDFLRVTSPVAIINITIRDLTGQTLFSGKYSDHTAILNLGFLPPGMFFVTINGTESRKFVKN